MKSVKEDVSNARKHSHSGIYEKSSIKNREIVWNLLTDKLRDVITIRIKLPPFLEILHIYT